MTKQEAIEMINAKQREIYAEIEESKKSESGKRGRNEVAVMNRACMMSRINGLEYAKAILIQVEALC